MQNMGELQNIMPSKRKKIKKMTFHLCEILRKGKDYSDRSRPMVAWGWNCKMAQNNFGG